MQRAQMHATPVFYYSLTVKAFENRTKQGKEHRRNSFVTFWSSNDESKASKFKLATYGKALRHAHAAILHAKEQRGVQAMN